MTEGPPPVEFWAGMFDGVADLYDQSGVAFFGPIAAGLVERLDPRPGERVLDLGSGRGAATLPIAAAVGGTGAVTAVDASSRMVELLRVSAQERGLDHVSVEQGDATAPPVGPYDVVCGSLVLFFLPDPVAALAAWRDRLVPAGRVGISTFAPWPEGMRAVMQVLKSFHAPDAPDTTSMPPAFGSDEGVAGLCRAAGFEDVRTERASYDIVFRDVDQWLDWAVGTAVRGPWMQVPEDRRPEALDRIAAELAARDHTLEVDIRYTLASG